MPQKVQGYPTQLLRMKRHKKSATGDPRVKEVARARPMLKLCDKFTFLGSPETMRTLCGILNPKP